MPLRLTFLGSDPWSVPSLEAVAASPHEVALVVTREPKPAGRGKRLRPTAVADAARALGLPLAEVRTVKEGEGLEALVASAPDVLVVVAYGEILPEAVLSLPVIAPVNVHFSILPGLRGSDPVRRAIWDGLEETGITTMRMDEGMDTGPILLQEAEPIRDDDDAGTLGARLADLGGRVLVRTLDGLERGDLQEQAQPADGATAAKRIAPEEEWVDWSAPAREVVRRIRALAPDPGARTRFRGKTLKVLRARAADGHGEPGTILDPAGPMVAAADRAVLLEEVLPEGKRRMRGEEFARGYRPETGERLG